MLIAATVWEVVAEHAGTFLFGLLIGLVASSRYRIVRVGDAHTTNGGKPPCPHPPPPP